MFNKGDTINLDKARVLSVKDDYEYYNGRPRWHRRIMVEDHKLGRVWFKTAATFTESLFDNNLLSCTLTVSGLGENIIFAKNPKDALIINEVV